MNWTEEQYNEARQRQKGGDANCDAPTAEAPMYRGGVPARAPSHDAPSRTSGGAPKWNKWEESFAKQELEPRRLIGEIQWYGFEAIKLRLADKTYYTPDFAVLESGRLRFVEIKGFIRDDAAVKTKVAAEMFPHFRFTMLRKKKMREGGGWEVIKDLNA